jgi:hypothetical protein
MYSSYSNSPIQKEYQHRQGACGGTTGEDRISRTVEFWMLPMECQFRFQEVNVFSDQRAITYSARSTISIALCNALAQDGSLQSRAQRRERILPTAESIASGSSNQAIQPRDMALSLADHDRMAFLQHLVYRYQSFKCLDFVG